MKILFLGINYAPELTGIAVYTAGLARELAARGHEVEIVTAPPYYPDWKIGEGHSAFRYHREQDHGVKVTRCPLYVPEKPNGPKRILHHLSFALTSTAPAILAALRMRPDVIFTVSPSLFSAPVGALAARLSGAKHWSHIQDFEVEAAFATGQLKSEGAVSRFAKSFEKFCLSLADRCSSISPAMCRKLADKGVEPSRVYQFNNWADIDSIRPMAASPFRGQWNINTEHVGLYSGSIAEKQGLENLIEAARLLKDRIDLTFVICGNGPNRARLEKRAEGLNNIQFHDLQPFERLNDLLSLATIHLLPQKADAADLLLPSKLTNMLASGRPVIAGANAGTGLADAVEGCGISVEPDCPGAMAAGLSRLIEDPAAHAKYSAAARQRALRDWSKQQIISGLEQEMTALTAAAERPQVGTTAVLPGRAG